jgi:hypothetical protein
LFLFSFSGPSNKSNSSRGLDAFNPSAVNSSQQKAHSDGSYQTRRSTDLLSEEDLISFKSCSSFDESDIYEARQRRNTFTSFSSFGGVGASTSGTLEPRDFEETSQNPMMSAADTAAAAAEQQASSVNAKQRWQRALLKIQAAKAFQGAHIGGDAQDEA